MPLPKPKDDENQQDFISRCMGNDQTNEEFPDRDQRAAVCHTQWRKARGKALIDNDTHLEKACLAPNLHVKIAEGADAGWIEGYAATWDIDQGGDQIVRGAFRKTLAERVPAGKVKLMIRHYATGAGVLDVIGTVTEAKEDKTGLWYHAELAPTEEAQKARRLVQSGHVSTDSLGYRLINDEWVTMDGKEIHRLLELFWAEVTLTTIPMNEHARITAVKTVPDSSLREPVHTDADRKSSAGRRTDMHQLHIARERHWLELQAIVLGAKALTHSSKLAESEPAWGSVDNRKLPRAAFAERGDADKVSSWGYPHHWVQNGGNPDEDGRYRSGMMFLHKGGLHAAWAAAQGARSGRQASAAVKAHLNAHRKAIGERE